MLCAAAAAAGAADRPAVRWGADVRIRQEYYDHIPAASGGFVDGGLNNLLRVRPRVWGEYAPVEDFALRLRVTEEFRHVWSPEDRTDWKYPDELVVDNLYLDARGLADGRLALRIGRQDLLYGNGILVADGTPGDGTRTAYFDAVTATWKGVPKNSFDLLAICNRPENDLALHSRGRDLTRQTRNRDGIVESGGGLYGQNTFFAVMPFEYYYLFKRESAWDQPAARTYAGFAPPSRAWQRLDAAAGRIENPELNVHTAGLRLQPHLAEGVVATFEADAQFGERGGEEVRAYGVDAKLRVDLADGVDATAGIYRLSGDDPATDRDEGWNPLWARATQCSDLYAVAFQSRRWSNLNMAYAALAASPAKALRCEARLARLTAIEEDGPGPGDERGWLYTLKVSFTLAADVLAAGDRLAGHVLVEGLQPGDYHDADDTAVFARWQMQYEF